MTGVLQSSLISSFDPRLPVGCRVDAPLSRQRDFVRVSRHRLVSRQNRAVDVLAAVHGAHAVPVAAATDALVVYLVAVLVGTSTIVSVALPLVLTVAAYLGQVYTPRDTVQTRGFLWYPARMVAPLAAVGLIAAGAGLVRLGEATALGLVTLCALAALRAMTWTALVVLRRRGFGLRQTLILGNGDQAGTVWRRLVEFPEAGLLPVQLLTYESARAPGAVERELTNYDIRHVVLVAPGPEDALITSALPRQRTRAPFFSTVPPLAELFLDPRSVSEVGGIPLISLGRVTHARRSFPGKRVLDLVAAAVMSLALLPLAIVVAVCPWQ